jgi:hypothetical protein
VTRATSEDVWADLRRVEPVSRSFGLDRGTPIDRYYIENFLRGCASDIAGWVLEVGDASYTRKFGGERVTRSDVLHTPPGGKSATVIGDLERGAGIEREAFDCIILTQVLPFIFDVRAAVANVHAALRPGGVVLVSVPCISQISRFDMDRWGDFWRFTDLSARRLFEDAFGKGRVEVKTYGNALAATAFIQGIAMEELNAGELDYSDADYQVIITIRAKRAAERT